MCGIAGIYNLNGQGADIEKAERMIEIIKHRGPDDRGFYARENIALGQCRLSILDLSPRGHQPMTNEDKSLWIVFNGEIYNYLELKAELKRLGHDFRTNTDTEVILHAYEQWGKDCLNKFNGMWAFAVWNEKKRELFCARDRFGVKPFYYFFDGNLFLFASEIKAILKCGIKGEVNDDLVYDFLKFGMLEHTNDTFFKKIAKLPPASFFLVNEVGLHQEKYWDFEVSNEINGDCSLGWRHRDEFLDLFLDSVKKRLRSDVPIGSCLSGGLDSSSIVCAVNRILKEENIESIGAIQKTFSSCFDDQSFDEREYIEEVIKVTGAEKNYVFPSPDEFIAGLKKIIIHQEEPFAGASIIAQWDVFKAAREKVKILLDGQGADENLCGYRKFYYFYLNQLFKKKNYITFATEAVQFFSSWEILRTTDFKKGLKYFECVDKFVNKEDFLNEEFKKKYRDRKLGFGLKSSLGQRIKEDITMWSLPALLRYEDKNSMAFSLETRLPFLDYRLVEKVASFPLNQKMSNGWTKFVLREAMRGILPEKIRSRKSKLGFATPEDRWIKEVFMDGVIDTFNKSRFIDNFADKKNLIKSTLMAKNGHGPVANETIFRFFILSQWADEFITNNK